MELYANNLLIEYWYIAPIVPITMDAIHVIDIKYFQIYSYSPNTCTYILKTIKKKGNKEEVAKISKLLFGEFA